MADGLTGGTAGLLSLIGKVATIVFLGTSGAVLWLGVPASDPGDAEIVNTEDQIRERALEKAEGLRPDEDADADAADRDPAFELAWQSDYEGMIERLKTAGKVEPPEPDLKPEAVTEPDDGENTEADDPPPPSKPDIEVFYLGMIDEGTQRVALVRVGASQRFMRIGTRRSFLIPDEAFESSGAERPEPDEDATVTIEVTSIEPEEIGVNVGDESRTVQRQLGEGVAVATSGGESPTPRARQPQSGQARSSAPASRQQEQEREREQDSDIAARRAELIKQRPQRTDFTSASGETDIDAYRSALRDWSDKLRDLNRQNGQR
ncbi:MAG: hypothetical protein AAF235_11990 [Planctomycetota bacterium]